MKKRTDSILVRAHNEQRILQAVREHVSIGRPQLAKITKLSHPAVSVITDELVSRGVLLNTGRAKLGRRGQPAISLELNPDALFTFGISIERDNISVALLNFCGEVLESSIKELMYPSPEQALEFVKSTVVEFEKRLGKNVTKISGCGIATSALMGQLEHGEVPSEFLAWQDIDVKDYFAEHLPYPIVVERVATAATIAENFFGHGKLTETFIYLYSGLYFGGGIILDGELYRGANGRSGDIGLSSVYHKGELCNLIDCCSLQDLQDKFRSLDDIHDTSPSALESLIESHKKTVDDWAEDVSCALSQILITTISMLDINTIVVGGRLPQSLNEIICKKVNKRISEHFSVSQHPAKLILGESLPHLTALGAAILPLYDTFRSKESAIFQR